MLLKAQYSVELQNQSGFAVYLPIPLYILFLSKKNLRHGLFMWNLESLVLRPSVYLYKKILIFIYLRSGFYVYHWFCAFTILKCEHFRRYQFIKHEV